MKVKSSYRWYLLPIILLGILLICMATSCAKKEVEKYTITILDAPGGIIYADKTEVNKGENVTITVEVFSLYELVSLNVNTEEVIPINNIYTITNIESDILVSATFVKKSVLVSFDVGEGAEWVNNEPPTMSVSIDEPYGELPKSDVVTKANYMFIGWYTSGGELVTEETLVTETNAHTLYAQWTPAITNRTASSSIAFTGNDDSLSYVTKAPSFATIDGVDVAQGSVSSTLVYDKSEPTRTGLIFKGSFENNMTNLEDSTAEYGAWATGVGAQYYMFYIEMQSGTLLLYKTTGTPGLYIEVTPLEKAGEAYRNKFNSGATEFELKATYCLNENGGLIIKLYIDNELQLWFEDASPLQGSSVGFCSTKANTEFKNFKYDTNVTLDMGSPIVSTHIAFTVSKGASGEYNTYKGWTNSRSIAYLNEVWLDKSIESKGKVSANITPNGTKNAIILFASTSDVSTSATGINGMHFILEPTANGNKMYIACVRNQNWVITELGTNAVDLALPLATTYGIEIEYAVQANKDILFTYNITVGENTYVRTALWPAAWDSDVFWSRNNFKGAVALWQEAGGNSVVFGDVEYEGSKGIYDLTATPSKEIGASGSVSVDVTLNGAELGIAMFGEVTPSTLHGFKGVLCYVSKTGVISIGFAKLGEYISVVDSTTLVDVNKQMHIVYEYSIAENGVCTYKATVTQDEIVVAVVECKGTVTGDYWNQDNLGNDILVYHQPLTIGSPIVENVVYTQK